MGHQICITPTLEFNPPDPVPPSSRAVYSPFRWDSDQETPPISASRQRQGRTTQRRHSLVRRDGDTRYPHVNREGTVRVHSVPGASSVDHVRRVQNSSGDKSDTVGGGKERRGEVAPAT